MKKFLTGGIIFFLLFTGCPQPETDSDIFTGIKVADFFVFAEGDTSGSVTKPFPFQTEKTE